MRDCGDSCCSGDSAPAGVVGIGVSPGGLSGGSPPSGRDEEVDPIVVDGCGALCVTNSGGNCRGGLGMSSWPVDHA